MGRLPLTTFPNVCVALVFPRRKSEATICSDDAVLMCDVILIDCELVKGSLKRRNENVAMFVLIFHDLHLSSFLYRSHL
jgi:hypothetical protein